jgi:hypothetical protein
VTLTAGDVTAPPVASEPDGEAAEPDRRRVRYRLATKEEVDATEPDHRRRRRGPRRSDGGARWILGGDRPNTSHRDMLGNSGP